MRSIKKSFLLFPFLLVIFACNPTRHIPAGEYLLAKNDIHTDTTILAKERFEPFIKQKPNRKILGLFRFHLWMYNLCSSSKKENNWLKKIGEAPAIVDTELTARTKQQLTIFLNRNGFFNAVVKDSISVKNKKATVHYIITYNQPYTIREINYSSLDTTILPLINSCKKTSLLIQGDRYDSDVLDKEREKIASDLKNKGYYFFNKNYITYQIDTTLNKHQADIYLYVNRINENINPSLIGNSPVLNHHTYKLRNIYIETDYNPKNPINALKPDTLFTEGFYFISKSKPIVRPNILARCLYLHSGDLYLQTDLDYSYNRLQDLNIFKFINLFFNEVKRDSTQKDYLLDLNIQLTPTDKLDLTLESEATNTGGNIGIAASASYRNKNLARGAEVLEVRIKGGLEAIPNFNDSIQKTKLFFFNTYEIGPDVTFSVKRFLPAVLDKLIPPRSNPRTNINLGYNYQNRPDYVRTVSNFSFYWTLSPGKKSKFLIYPFDINSVRVSLSAAFIAKIEGNPRLIYTYQTHFISSFHFTWVYTNQNMTKSKNFIFFRLTPEFAYKAVSVKYNPSQYSKLEADFSYHKYLNPFNNLVYRIAAGYGYPYGNSSALPFEKSFFSGGANSIRAWAARTLGPGAYNKGLNIEESGDIKIESNIELRSELIRFPNDIVMEGAAFIDAGNVWTRNEDLNRPGSKFEFNNFISQLGIGGGLGLRFNFSFFILRLDGGVKLRDPALEATRRWVYPNHKFGIGDITGSLAIGYPF